jgi:chaperonin GroES
LAIFLILNLDKKNKILYIHISRAHDRVPKIFKEGFFMLKPLHDHVVLEVIKKEQTTKGGIILSEKDQEQPSIGQVIAIGDGAYKEGQRLPMSVSIGDQVVFKKYATTDVKLDGKDYLIIKESDILAIVKE